MYLILACLLSIDFTQAALEIVEAGQFLNQLGLCPATSGNFSRKLDENCFAVTVSGKYNAKLSLDDVMMVDMEGKAVSGSKKPSAETLLHSAIYSCYPEVEAILHTHSIKGCVLSRLLAPSKLLATEGYEIHKAFEGIKTHESRLEIPIFENTQDMTALSAEISAYFRTHPRVHGFLIRDHGLYTWGRTMQEVKIRIEAFEYLFESELLLRSICSY